MRFMRWMSRWRGRSLQRFSDFACGGDELRRDTEVMWDGAGSAYRLQAWPDLRPAHKTARIYRALSVMTTRPVSVAWFSKCAGLPPHDAQRLIDWLVSEDCAKELVLARARVSHFGELE